MGHIRLGTIPKTRSWNEVVTAYAQFASQPTGSGVGTGSGGASAGNVPPQVETIAARALEAADKGLHIAVKDEGFLFTFYLLTQLASKSKQPDWQVALKRAGIDVNEQSSVLDLTSAFNEACDNFTARKRIRSDVAEMAQKAASEALYQALSERHPDLFNVESDSAREGLRNISTKTGFGALGQRFFARFLNRFLGFYLSRITGSSNDVYATGVSGVSEFNRMLALHCDQSARIVRNFAGEWYSKTEYQQGINERNTARFVAVALQKLQAEIKAQGNVQR